ncbi:MAG: ABC transporter ATP-binding protein [Oscillospiraceae bacterium]|nr:ABC transporter ATP-binding protein [Oscillospiraceae bacterium]
MKSEEVILSVEHLSVDFRIDRRHILHAVKDVSFQIHAGETLGILGESGCGKSVSCMSILQLNNPRTTIYPQGKILFQGQDLLSLPPKKMQSLRGGEIAMIFQEPMTAMNPLFTIGDQMREAVRIHDPSASKAQAGLLCADMLRQVGIANAEGVMDSYPLTLSGGMLQRVMIAAAMLNKPSLLICDEPTTALDVTIQAQVLELMNRLKEEHGTSILFITHDLGVISEMADRCMVMYGGTKCEEAPTDELFSRPLHPYTEGLVNSHPRSDYQGDRLRTIPGSVPSLKDMPQGCPFHNRCPYAQDRCRTELPPMQSYGENRIAACYHLQKEEVSAC